MWIFYNLYRTHNNTGIKMNTIIHHKKSNSGLIFELLSQQVVSNKISKDDIKAKKALYLIKKYFNKDSQLLNELNLFNAVLYSEQKNWQSASHLLSEVLSTSKKLDLQQLKNEKYALLTEINSSFDKDTFFKTYVPNYKTYASIYSLMEAVRNNKINDVKQKVQIEESVINHLLNNKEVKRINEFAAKPKGDLPVDELTYWFIIKKFNSKYDKTLNETQKQILQEYIRCTSDNSFDRFAEKKVKTFEHDLYGHMKNTQNKDRNLLHKIFEALQKLYKINETKNRQKKAEMLMTYSQLISELNSLKNETV
jgi:hypothetical protein